MSKLQLIHHVSVPCRYSILPVNRDGSSDTQGSMSVCFHHRIIRDGHEPLVRNCLSVKIGRIKSEPAITSNECKDRKILLNLQMDIEKSTIFIQLFGNVNAMLYLCTQSIAPIVERKIPTAKYCTSKRNGASTNIGAPFI